MAVRIGSLPESSDSDSARYQGSLSISPYLGCSSHQHRRLAPIELRWLLIWLILILVQQVLQHLIDHIVTRCCVFNLLLVVLLKALGLPLHVLICNLPSWSIIVISLLSFVPLLSSCLLVWSLLPLLLLGQLLEEVS